MSSARKLKDRIAELEELLESSERKADILTNLLREADTEYEQALARLSVSEANFRAIFENAPEAIFIVAQDTQELLDCNAFACSWLGYTWEEIQTLSWPALVQAPAAQQGFPQPAGSSKTAEVSLRHWAGHLLEAEVTSAVLNYRSRPSWLILARDITERKKLEELNRYKQIFESVTDAVFINDYSGRILEVNDVVCQRLGYRREELLGLALKHLTSPEWLPILYETREKIKQEKTVRFEMEVLTKDGVRIPMEFHARRITYLGQPAVLGLARDLSLRKKLEQTLVERARLSAVGEMASGVAHNFNNLLQMISGATEAALAKLEAGKIRESREIIASIRAVAQRGGEIVRRIKDFINTRDHRLAGASVFDLSELVREAVDLTRLLWENQPQIPPIELHLDLEADCLVQGQPSEIYEVLVNLIKNALEAMPQGGTLRLRTRIEGDKVVLQVSDTGVGIPPDQLERIFQPFFTTKGLKSTGLGLSSSYGIIKRHQGTIHAESLPGQGTTFTVSVPLASAGAVAAPEEIPVAAPGRLRFLLIEDEVSIIRSMAWFFEETEVEMVACRSAQEGLELYQQQPFDVVLCDLGMDDLSGWEVGRRIKEYCQHLGLPKTPFLLYTGWDRRFSPEQLEACGVDQVVIKPVPFDQLLQILRELTGQRRQNPPVSPPGLAPGSRTA